MEFAWLIAAALAWFGLHAGVAGSGLRGWLVARFGDKAYRGGFSLASLACLWWLVHQYRAAPFRALWSTPAPLGYVPLLVVPLALVLAAGAFSSPSPTSVGGEKLLSGDVPVRGVMSITRHPFLWSAVLWSAAHLLVNSDWGSWLFFGALGATALRGTYDIDRKRMRVSPAGYARFEAQTSNVPFAALLAGRARLSLRELWLPCVLGLLLSAAAIALHPYFFNVPALPRWHG